MKVLLIAPYYAPDLGPSAPLFTMLCEDLVRLGHAVSVVAAVPHYPTGRVPPEFRGRVIQRECLNGVDVTRVWIPSVDRGRLGQRALSFLCYQLLASVVGLRRGYDALIVANPALWTGLPFLTLATVRRKPAIFSVHDIYPDVGVRLGIFRHPMVTSLVSRMEGFCLDHAAYVRVLSEGFQQTYLRRNVPEGKLALIWDWLDTEFIQPASRQNDFSARHGLEDHFVVMYAGNIGLSQGLDQVIDVAELLAGEPSIKFVLVGDGAGKVGLEDRARSHNLNNVQFIPFQPREILPQVLASADLSLIVLKQGIGADSVPSKCYSILASGRPVVASIDEGSDTWKMIARANCGRCVRPQDPAALAGAIMELYRDELCRTEFGANGRRYAVEHHSRMSAAKQFERLLVEVGSRRPLQTAAIAGAVEAVRRQD